MKLTNLEAVISENVSLDNRVAVLEQLIAAGFAGVVRLEVDTFDENGAFDDAVTSSVIKDTLSQIREENTALNESSILIRVRYMLLTRWRTAFWPCLDAAARSMPDRFYVKPINAEPTIELTREQVAVAVSYVGERFLPRITQAKG